MADRWMDERERRDRDWRRSEAENRGSGRHTDSEGRSFDDGSRGYQGQESRGQGYGDRVFGERESGMGYGGETAGRYGAAEGRRSGWQDRDYGGVSPAMRQGEYDLERQAERYDREHRVQRGLGERGGYGRGGGRYYGDSGREDIYREEWSQGRRDYGAAPRGYDAGRSREWSGGTGGYDYERGYGDGGRGYQGRDRTDRTERFERAGHDAGDFFRRAGERVASWFGGAESEGGYGDRERGFRGMGPKGYKRSDERLSDEAHERLTEDPYVDASNINVSVSGGEVTLSGTVENREAKHRAERCVEDITGVTHVQNNLRVDRGSFLTSPSRGYGDSVLEHQMRGETGSGDGIPAAKTAGGSTSTDSGKSR